MRILRIFVDPTLHIYDIKWDIMQRTLNNLPACNLGNLLQNGRCLCNFIQKETKERPTF